MTAKNAGATADDILEVVRAKMDSMVDEYNQRMSEATKQYMDLVEQAQKQMADMSLAAQPVKRKPQAIWHEESGEKLLILNKEAADFFSEIFNNLGVLTNELQKKIAGK